MKALFHLPLAIALLGCAHTARHHAAPDATKLREQSARLSRAVVESRVVAQRVSLGIKAVAESHREERAFVIRINPQLAELARVAPPELMPFIHGMHGDVLKLKDRQEATDGILDSVKSGQADLTGRLEEANAAKNEVEKLTPEYFDKVDQLADRANAAEDGWQKADKAAARRGNFLGLMGGVLLAAIASHFMRLMPQPYGFALPLAAAPLGYLLARLLI